MVHYVPVGGRGSTGSPPVPSRWESARHEDRNTISRDWLIRFVEHRIGDRRLIRLLRKWLSAGVMEDGTCADTGHGTPQGSVVSPVLANIYLHYVLDLWFHRKWRRTVPEGEALIERYADDFVLGFQYKRDAERFVRDLRERMASFGLEVHPGKTRLVEFGRFAAANYKQRRQGRPGTFDFWDSRTTARRPGEGNSNSGASRCRSVSVGP